ncbi:hypothetical protein GYMLUDRAFT_167243 [Collybiopsis luxurians FD-317 M1]|uniref:amidase n=1 Tax=Collybiopsis luxurians FD-317 M1 TaxID=944289 RepID=A0A0D0CE46_9AGAR|nr:hypothetical protein GYMLUDRAFT_167243 [Collybiopsis luxurians FD-317 M1]
MSLNISWPPVAQDVVAQREASIPETLRLPSEFIARYPPGSNVFGAAAECRLMSDKELQLTDPSNDATSILSAIKAKEVTAVEVLTAFCKRAAVAHQLLCCLTGIFFDEGLARARELDEYYETTGQLIGPLHGLPISVKDHMGIKRKQATCGFSADLDRFVSTENSALNQILWNAGCVFYCKTNVPQSLMQIETYSFWGQTLNPHNTQLTSGGSSGGCGALVSFGGSPLSIGSDIGGSVRSPASCCGIYSLKPTTRRLPGNGLLACSPTSGNDAIVPTCGPLARSSRDINLFFDVVLSAQPWSQSLDLLPLPWRSDPIAWSGSGGKIRLGVMWNDGNVLPQPPVRRALRRMVDALKQTNKFDIVDYEPVYHKDLTLMAVSTKRTLTNLKLGASLRAQAAATGESLCPLTEWVITLPGVKDHTIHELWEASQYLYSLRAKYYAYWNSQNIDVLLCPVNYGPAQPLQTTKYTSAFNCADFPAAVFPTGLKVDATLDPKDEPRDPWSEADAHSMRIYDPELLNNAPLCLQLAGKRNADEAVMQALKEIEQVLPLQN